VLYRQSVVSTGRKKLTRWRSTENLLWRWLVKLRAMTSPSEISLSRKYVNKHSASDYTDYRIITLW